MCCLSYNYPLVFDPEVSAKVANVSFGFGVRTKQHKHVGGDQILLVTASEGIVSAGGRGTPQTPRWGCGGHLQ